MKVSADELWAAAVERRKITWARRTLHQVRHKAKERQLACSITLADIDTPILCPFSLRKLNYFNRKRDWDSPCLERYEPGLGYVKGNVFTASYWISSVKAGRGWGVFEAEAEKILAEALKVYMIEHPSIDPALAFLRKQINDALGD